MVFHYCLIKTYNILFLTSSIIASFNASSGGGGSNGTAITVSGPYGFSTTAPAGAGQPYSIRVAYELPASEVTAGYLPTHEQIVTCFANLVPADSNSVLNLYNAGTLSQFSSVTSTLFAETLPTTGGSSPNDQTSFAHKIYKPILAAVPIIGWLLI